MGGAREAAVAAAHGQNVDHDDVTGLGADDGDRPAQHRFCVILPALALQAYRAAGDDLGGGRDGRMPAVVAGDGMGVRQYRCDRTLPPRRAGSGLRGSGEWQRQR